MDTIKRFWPQIAIGVAASAISIFLLLRAANQGRSTPESSSPFKEIIDQRANQALKEQEGRKWMINYI
jgi:hypothetical protein